MPELRGIISEEELQAYGGANIALLNNSNNTTGSGGEMHGSGEYEWDLVWTSDGFSGQGWDVGSWNTYYDLEGMFNQGGNVLEDWLAINDRAANIANAMSGLPWFTENGCGGLHQISV